MEKPITLEEKIKMIEQCRQDMHRDIDEQCDALIESIKSGVSLQKNNKHFYTLNEPAHLFKGKKPVAITFPNGRKEYTDTWKKVAVELLADCNSEPTRHNRLLTLCDSLNGRTRRILCSTPDSMDVPIKIDDGLYFESKFDTQMLITILTDKIFRLVGYNYSGIEVQVREPSHNYTVTEQPSEEQILSL